MRLEMESMRTEVDRIPIMDQASFYDGLQAGACRGCRYEYMDKDECRDKADCRLPPLPQAIDGMTNTVQRVHATTVIRKETRKCQFPGCEKRRDADYCVQHGDVVRNRRKIGWPEDRLHDPIQIRKCKKRGSQK